MDPSNPQQLSIVALGSIQTTVESVLDESSDEEEPSNREGTETIKRQRRTVASIMSELGRHTRQYYRMDDTSFWILHDLLGPEIRKEACQAVSQVVTRRQPTAPNGLISSSVRLSVAIRYFAGGEALDIALVHGICHAEVFRSVWIVVNAIHNTAEMDISFPYNNGREQRRIAKGFEDKSAVGFKRVVGAVDGMLVWIGRPPMTECRSLQVGPKKFFCGRKKKFGLNMQAVACSRRKFLDVSIGHPGSTSDYLVYVTSPLYYRLQAHNALLDGFTLFGDNAYVPSPCMVTPFKGAKSGAKDAFNFYHSQLRITIECAFGMLVGRFGVLRKPIAKGITLAKTTKLTYALCKLHNFCIDHNANIVPPAADPDAVDIALAGGVPLEGENQCPNQLIGGGEHFDDVDRNVRRQDQRASTSEMRVLPQQSLLEYVTKLDVRRPTPRHWKQT